MRLKNLRKMANKTQKEIADILNITTVSYGRYELETSEPNIETLCKLADFYNVSLDYLVGRKFKNDLGFLTQEQFNFLSDFLSLSDSDQQKVMGYISALKQNTKN